MRKRNEFIVAGVAVVFVAALVFLILWGLRNPTVEAAPRKMTIAEAKELLAIMNYECRNNPPLCAHYITATDKNEALKQISQNIKNNTVRARNVKTIVKQYTSAEYATRRDELTTLHLGI